MANLRCTKRQPPRKLPPTGRMQREGLEWLVKQIREWRIAVGLKQKPDAEGLAEVFWKLQAEGLPEALAVYVVLACEWLLRVRKLDGREVNGLLAEIERGLGQIMTEDAAHLAAAALGPRVRELIKSERRLAIALEEAPPSLSTQVTELGPDGKLISREARVPGSVLMRSGPVPYAGPWIAGHVIAELLKKRGSRKKQLGMDLTSELLGKQGSLDAREFRRRRTALGDQLLGRLVEELTHRFGLIREYTHPEIKWPDEWQRALPGHLLILGPQGIFPANDRLVLQILSTYRIPAAGRSA